MPLTPASEPAAVTTAQSAGANNTRAPSPGCTGLLAPALNAERQFIQHRGQRVAVYLSVPPHAQGQAGATPLVLLHSINAAASAAEVKPIFDRYAQDRPVLAIELPGFGASDRRPIAYTPELMVGCVHAALQHLRDLGFPGAVDLMAVSLACEFAARAALENPAAFRSLALVSPTGFSSARPERYDNGKTKDKPRLRWLLERELWSQRLFRWLTSEKIMRTFLQRAWGSRPIDEGLVAYNLLTVAQPGASHAPYAFVGGRLFTRGVAHLYAQLQPPVWMIHGLRGEFARVDGLKRFAPAGRWTIESIDAGAMPYFELPDEFAQRYDAFVDSLSSR
jgi:pimeloyl-ACP methyl ester carboxylesterase